MTIKTIKVGELQCNCYILEQENQVLIVDPGSEPSKIINHISTQTILGILITHCHPDHIGALSAIQEKYTVPIYQKSNLSEKEYHIGNFKFQVIFTPGHTTDSISYYFPLNEIMLTGDFLFAGTIGRCDLEGGDVYEMQKSLTKIKQYQDIIKIYPGHGKSTILGQEKLVNPYLKT